MVLSPRELPGFFTIRGIKLPARIIGQSGEHADPMASGDQRIELRVADLDQRELRGHEEPVQEHENDHGQNLQ